MKKLILSVLFAAANVINGIVSFNLFAATCEALFAFMVVISAFGVIASVGYTIEGTSAEDKLSELFMEDSCNE